MSIAYFNQITNISEKRSVIIYGNLPNKRGPSGNGFSVVLGKQSLDIEKNFYYYLGNEEDDALIVETGGGEINRLTWRIKFDPRWGSTINVSVATDGTGEFNPVGEPIMSFLDERGFGVLALWISNSSIIIGNLSEQLSKRSDHGQKSSFFVFPADVRKEVEGTNDPACLVTAP